MVHCFHLAGFPKGLINCVTGKGSEIGDFLTMHPGVNCIRYDYYKIRPSLFFDVITLLASYGQIHSVSASPVETLASRFQRRPACSLSRWSWEEKMRALCSRTLIWIWLRRILLKEAFLTGKRDLYLNWKLMK